MCNVITYALFAFWLAFNTLLTKKSFQSDLYCPLMNTFPIKDARREEMEMGAGGGGRRGGGGGVYTADKSRAR